jgi:hypothetical protein
MSSCPATDTTGASEAGGSPPHLDAQPSAQHMSSMALASELVARLWELLADACIVGQAQGPAAWVPSTEERALNTCEALGIMLSSCSGWIALQMHDISGGQEGTRATRGDSSPGTEHMSSDQHGTAGQGSLGGHGATQPLAETEEPAVRRLLQPCPLALAVPWERLKSAASKLGGGLEKILQGAQFVHEACTRHEHSICLAGSAVRLDVVLCYGLTGQ